MQFRPCLHHALLALGQTAGNQFNRVNSINRDFLLIIGVEMRRMVFNARFHVHPDNDPKKTAQLWHGTSLPPAS